jgi:RsiW-degrading membrane proteinase PrsW (M82 family)
MGLAVASLLVIFTYVMQPHLPAILATNSWIYAGFIAACTAIGAIFLISKKQRWSAFLLSSCTIIALLAGGHQRILAGAPLGLLVLKAAWEEILKTTSAQSLTARSGSYNHNVVIMSILAWLGFALFENIVYMWIGGSWSQFIVRSLTTSLVHAIFTWCIGYMLSKRSSPSYISYVLAYCAGIALHSIYNISMQSFPVIGGFVFIIGGYFLLSYLFYKSERLYYHA